MSDLNIRLSTASDFDTVLLFNQKAYPHKKKIKEVLTFWSTRSKDAVEKNLVLVDSKNNVHGQMFVSEMAYYYKGQKVDSYWEYDLIVEENLRKSAWGVDLLLYCMDLYPNSCSTGSGPQALPVHLKLGKKKLGEIKKYVKVRNLFYLLSSYGREEISITKFPKEIIQDDHHFYKIGISEVPDFKDPFNNDYFEISRDKLFLEWRFFSGLHNYVFYKDSESNCYFVVRTIKKKGFTALVLVDYRFTLENVGQFDSIINAFREIASRLRLGLMICGSSLSSVDTVLENHNFKSIGRPRPILGLLKCKDRKGDIENRNFCFITLADSDGETNW